MKALPEGKSLGWMQAPASWITTHTLRFIGVVRVVIQDGEGCILIKKGKPLFYYFKHGTIELKGNTALDYLNSHPVIDFNLCKYTPDEFALALKVCNIEDHERVVPQELDVSVPVSREHTPPSRPADPPVTKPVGDKKIPEPDLVYPKVQRIENRTAVSGAVAGQPTPPSRPADPPVATTVGDKRIPDPVAVNPRVHTLYKRAVVPQPAAGDDTDITILSQIREIDGVVAISVFNDNRIVLMVGDSDSETLLKIARTMLETAKKITPRITWGPFIHMTIEIPAGNMIIAPYHDNYVCLLTTRTINIGHIRRILRDLQRKGAPQCVT
jgi:predicted regulator of Ras-like GTPase activity (Roadblock/LC7/MglB family)